MESKYQTNAIFDFNLNKPLLFFYFNGLVKQLQMDIITFEQGTSNPTKEEKRFILLLIPRTILLGD